MRRTREYRRAQLERKKNRFRKDARTMNFGPIPITEKELDKWVGLKAATPHPNKCQCCCNLRRSNWYTKDEKLTMQERRAKREAEFEMKEVNMS